MPIRDKAGSGQRLREKKAEGRCEGTATDGCGTERYHKSESSVSRPVRKGRVEVGESKKEQDKLLKIACPEGRMRGETPKRE